VCCSVPALERFQRDLCQPVPAPLPPLCTTRLTGESYGDRRVPGSSEKPTPIHLQQRLLRHGRLPPPDWPHPWAEPRQGEEWVAGDAFAISASIPRGWAGWLCPSEVGASAGWSLLRVMRGGRTACTGIAACLEEAQVHGGGWDQAIVKCACV